MSESLPEVYLARHGETEWTIIAPAHRTDGHLRLTERGEDNARGLARAAPGPDLRSGLRQPAAAGASDVRAGRLRRPGREHRRPDRMGLRQLRGPAHRRDPPRAARLASLPRRLPGRRVGRGRRCPRRPGGRLGSVRCRGHVLLFGHGHFFRVLAARWLGLPPAEASHFLLGTAALSVLGYEHGLDDPAILLWNDDRHAVP